MLYLTILAFEPVEVVSRDADSTRLTGLVAATVGVTRSTLAAAAGRALPSP